MPQNILSESVDIRNRAGYKNAIEKYAKLAFEQFVYPELLEIIGKANDLEECDAYDIKAFIEGLEQKAFEYNEDELMEMETISIKDILKNENHYANTRTPIEDFIKEQLLDDCDDESNEDVFDDFDAEKIIHKYGLGGGGYEAERDFIIMTVEKMVEMIKAELDVR